jgi:hypothetical protein
LDIFFENLIQEKPYRLWVCWERIDRLKDKYETAVYNVSQFQSPGAGLVGTYTDYGMDTDEDGLFNYLAIDVAVVITSTGQYQLEGLISGPQSEFYPWSSNVFSLPTGTHTVTLGFDGRSIRASGASGQFQLANVSLYDQSSDLLIDWVNNAYTTTKTYIYSQFQDDYYNIYLPLISMDQTYDISFSPFFFPKSMIKGITQPLMLSLNHGFNEFIWLEYFP